jgi:two-component system, sensor histidine kinase RegB
MPDRFISLNAFQGGPDADDEGAPPLHWLGVDPVQTRTLVLLRWIAILGLFIALIVGRFILGAIEPIHWSIVILGVGAVANLALAVTDAYHHAATPWELTFQLGVSTLMMGGLLYFTGGVTNPFAIFIVAPVVFRASAPDFNHGVALAVMAMAICTTEIFVYRPLLLDADALDSLPYRLGQGVGLDLAIGISASAATFAAQRGSKRRLALNALQNILSREQRLSALGALAASAAHELGTPLATISIIAKELARELPEGSHRQDAEQLVIQSQRCRDILRRLSREPEQQDAMHERMSLMQFVRDLIDPWAGREEVRTEALVLGPPGARTPDIWRRPEIAHALASVVENAFDFARTHVLVAARFTEDEILVEVRDDGPGFSPSILARLGAPYVTQRPPGTEGRSGHTGTGLGFFIAKSLLERSGARIECGNHQDGGAQVIARWPRSVLEATEENWILSAT